MPTRVPMYAIKGDVKVKLKEVWKKRDPRLSRNPSVQIPLLMRPNGDAGKTYLLGFLGYASYEMRVALRVRYPLHALVCTACARCVMGNVVAAEYTRTMDPDHNYDVERVAEKEP